MISRNVYLFQVIKISILITSVDLKISILMRYVDFEKCIPVQVIKISILITYVDFQKFIPVSGFKNIYFYEVG